MCEFHITILTLCSCGGVRLTSFSLYIFLVVFLNLQYFSHRNCHWRNQCASIPIQQNQNKFENGCPYINSVLWEIINSSQIFTYTTLLASINQPFWLLVTFSIFVKKISSSLFAIFSIHYTMLGDIFLLFMSQVEVIDYKLHRDKKNLMYFLVRTEGIAATNSVSITLYKIKQTS